MADESDFVAPAAGHTSMNEPFIEIRGLWRPFWKDSLFVKLLATVVAGAGALAFVIGVDWEVVCGLIGLGCLAAMLDVTLRDKSGE